MNEKNLTPNTTLTLNQFIELFNDDSDFNKFWDLFYLKATDSNDNEIDIKDIQIIPRNMVKVL